ncbi:LamG domain-containing protein [Nonomuraea sp. K274]|uniref:LamG domain-containing protein n=1 Tax=Nonomuraea cypriaca TaxID=1187855 RepID=A0A931A4Q7_9ACTN|nr:LamG-like jellyroll fold domain-containing protein [Nonomuraea cypriaca]MBF8186166.1 LamG domain-containing protein [Nonomuraea cypriaca]
MGAVAVGADAAVAPATAAPASPAAEPAPPAGRAVPDTATEQGAQRAARQSGKRVEVGSMRTETRTVYATPEGSFVLEQHARPVRVRQDGRWTEVDTTLRRQADGSVAPVATAVGLRFSGGGRTPMATVARGARSLAVSWPGALPVPALDGATATYAEVLPGVDLQVTADVDGFSHVLVVKSRQAALSGRLDRLRYSLDSQGLSVRQSKGGGLQAVDPAGTEVFTAPTPLMWDTPETSGTLRAATAARPGEGPPPGSRHERMGLEVAGDTLALAPDRGMLTAPGTRYPIYLDPSVSAPRGAWTAVWRKYPNTNYLNSGDVARVGYEGQTGQTNRSFFQMNNGSAIHGKQIIRATLRTYESWSWSCGARPVELWLTSVIGNTTTWNNQPAWVAWLDTENVAKGWSTACPGGGVEFDATHAAVRAAAENWPTITLGLRAANEGDTYAWKKFHNNPVLVIEYNSPPATPAAADAWSDPGGGCVSGDARPAVGTATPKLWAKLRDGDNSVKGRFEWHRDGARIGEFLTPAASSGNAFYAGVPAGAYQDGSVIRWRVRAEDGIATSAWSPWCEIRVDTTAPEREPVVTSEQYPENAWGVGLGRAGSFTFGANGVADVTAFVYGLNDVPDTEVNASGGQAAVWLTPDEDGPNVLSVRSKDAAGKQGPIRSYVFNVRDGTGPTGHWTLDEGQGGAAADSAGDHPMTLGGAAWTDGRQAGALRFAGAGQHAATAAGIVASERNLAVSAWVRLAGTTLPDHNAAAVSQDGELHAGPWLGYRAATRSWSFKLNNSAGTSQSVWADNPAVVPRAGEWTHLTGVYDAAAKAMYLYVDGHLAAGPVPYHGGAGPAGSLRLGQAQHQGGMTDPWPGDVDDVRVWDRAVYADEIVRLVNQGSTPTGHWTLDEGTGTAAADATGRTGPLTLGGDAAWTQGWLGGALAVDGIAGHAAAGKAAVRTDQSFTVAAWVQLDTLPAADVVAVAQGGERTSAFALGYTAQGPRWGFGMITADADAPDLVMARSDAVPYTMEWTHVAGVYDAPARKLRVYVGGQFVAAAETDFHSTWNADGPLQVGRGIFAGAMMAHWPGTLDDVRTYQGALGDDDIARLAAE